MLVFRLAGKRTLKDVTVFDFVLLLVISEAVQEALTSDDYSVTNAWVIIATFVGIDITMSLVKRRFPAFDKAMDSTPLIIVENGKPHKERMAKERVEMDDLLEAMREKGYESLDQIKFAVLERNGAISLIPAGK